VIAIIPVRQGRLPGGAAESIAEAGGRAILVGCGTAEAAGALRLGPLDLLCLEAEDFAPSAWAHALAHRLENLEAKGWGGYMKIILLPASPDGRDLGPHLANELGRAFYAGAIAVTEDRVILTRADGRIGASYALDGPSVVTLQPGVRGVKAGEPAIVPRIERLEIGPSPMEHVALLEPDSRTIELSEAVRIVAGGQGLGSAEAFALLASVGQSLNAAVGGTRVAVDRGWLPAERQIGVTGASVAPDLYLAFGISGAVQHVAGLASPNHTIAVNLDANCPMMALADLAVVADAPAVLEHLRRLLTEALDG
jgi:electron transfer flavoprotein alpha subunit